MLYRPPHRLPIRPFGEDTAYAVGPRLLDLLLAEHRGSRVPRYRRLWDYYRNPALPGSGGEAAAGAEGRDPSTRVAQARGLPARLTAPVAGVSREIVIENDIAWRVHALIDFMVGKPVVIRSLADDPTLAAALTDHLNQTFEHNGGHGFFQDLALLGSIYGHVDVLLRPPGSQGGDDASGGARLEIIEAPRSVPLLDPGDYRRLRALIVHHVHLTDAVRDRPWLGRVLRRGSGEASTREAIERTEVWTADGFEMYHARRSAWNGGASERRRVEAGGHRLDRVPVVHFQNLPQPLHFEGLSDVEPLIPLQDELNTRLSDRANRVTFQSFKMYLGRGIDGFADRPVGPGQMWSTDNPDASVTEFGGDAATPSEDAHIQQIREALDKASGVSPIAAGVVGGKVGNLSSENAIRIVLLGLVARIEKKRTAYGHGIARLCELILHSADVSGRLPSRPEDRRVRLDWPEPFPDTTSPAGPDRPGQAAARRPHPPAPRGAGLQRLPGGHGRWPLAVGRWPLAVGRHRPRHLLINPCTAFCTFQNQQPSRRIAC